MLMVCNLVQLALANVQKNSQMDALACLFDLKLTSHNFFKFFEKRLRQFFGCAGNQAAAKLGDFAAGFRFCAVMKNGGLAIFGQGYISAALGKSGKATFAFAL